LLHQLIEDITVEIKIADLPAKHLTTIILSVRVFPEIKIFSNYYNRFCAGNAGSWQEIILTSP